MLPARPIGGRDEAQVLHVAVPVAAAAARGTAITMSARATAAAATSGRAAADPSMSGSEHR